MAGLCERRRMAHVEAARRARGLRWVRAVMAIEGASKEMDLDG
jgi:hypothetical protein